MKSPKRKGQKKTPQDQEVPKAPKAARDLALRKPTDAHVDRAEELLATGKPPAQLRRELTEGVSSLDGGRLARLVAPAADRAIAEVYQRWDRQSTQDAPYRRERVIRMAEQFYTESKEAAQFTAANSALQMIARMSGAFSQHDPKREAALAALGPVPDDPTMALIYAQKCMMFALQEVVTNPTIDPEKRLRWIADIGSKIGITHAKTLVQHKLDDIASRMIGTSETIADEMEDASTVNYPATSRLGSRDPRNGSVS